MARKNSNKKVIKAIDWHQDGKIIADFLNGFNVYPELTEKLDSADWNFSQELINEIVLWKVFRYVKVPDELLVSLNGLRNLQPGNHRSGETELKNLLACGGVRLPMASTILRFANPNVFQIYDRHICRAMSAACDKVAPKKAEEAVEKYWFFLDELVVLCGRLGIPFQNADRILFEFDKAVNPPLSKTQA